MKIREHMARAEQYAQAADDAKERGSLTMAGHYARLAEMHATLAVAGRATMYVEEEE